MGPWEFNSPNEVNVDWQKDQVGVLVNWVSDGVTPPLGAMSVDVSAKGMGAAVHTLPSNSNLAHYVLRATVRSEFGTATVQLYYDDVNFVRRLGPATAIDTHWTTITWQIVGSPNPDSAIAVRIAVYAEATSSRLWVDRIELDPPSGDAGVDAGL